MANKKLVLEEKDGAVLAGISQKDCDPLFNSFPGSLSDVLLEKFEGLPVLSTFVVFAETKWATNPRAPKYVTPKLATSPATSKPIKKKRGKASAKTQKTSSAPSSDETSQLLEEEETSQLPLLEEREPTEAELKAIEAEEVAAQSTSVELPKGYYLKDGSGPFVDIQLAMDALGIPKDNRPNHKRYSRLSKGLQEKIIDRTD